TGVYYVSFYADNTSSNTPNYMAFDDFTVDVTPSCVAPTSVSVGSITNTSASVSFTSTGNNFVIEYGLTGFTPGTGATAGAGGTVVTGIASPITISGLTGSTTYQVYVRQNCGSGLFSANATAVTFTTTNCTPASITSTTPGSRCGIGTVTLGATANGGATINWYAAATGGSVLANGTSFSTPSLSTTTTYYAEAALNGTPFNVGLASDVAANLSSFGGYGMYFSTVSAATINTVDIYPSTAGTLNVTLRNAANTVVDTRTFTITAADISTTVKKTLTLGFSVPANTTGWQIYYDLAINRGAGTYNYPYTSNNFSITGNTLDGNNITGGTRYYFFNWNVTPSCLSARTAVIATVNTPPAITVSATPSTICSGQNATINATSSNAGYTYVWTPGGLTGASQTVAPTATTKYVVTATDNSGGANNGCSTKDSVSITVNPAPGTLTITNSNTSLCAGSVATLTANGGITNNVTLLSEDFNGTLPGWTQTNASTGGTPANAAWSVVNDGYVYSETFHSNDNSKFVLSNSDAQGSGGTTLTYLSAPVLNTTGYNSLSLNFYHYFKYYFGATNDSATVEVSIDNTNWTPVQVYKGTSVGSSSAFANASVNLNSYINNATLYIRFKYTSTFGYYWAIDNVSVTGNKLPSIVWTPSTGLYTDAAATVAYAGGNTATIYAKPTGNSTYTATATGVSSCTATANTSITINAATAITTQPTAQAVCAGANATFTVAATGSGTLTYQWRKGGTNISGATSSTLTLTNVTAADAANYDVVVTGGCGNITSTAVALTVNAAPSITTQPTAQNACPGTNASFSVVATGAGLTYQWRKAGVNIIGATSSTLTLTNVSASDAANYDVVITGT
ncbi:MAG: hypothetical protein C4329_15775, partial [Chitinophagaceae bacterium]